MKYNVAYHFFFVWLASYAVASWNNCNQRINWILFHTHLCHTFNTLEYYCNYISVLLVWLLLCSSRILLQNTVAICELVEQSTLTASLVSAAVAINMQISCKQALFTHEWKLSLKAQITNIYTGQSFFFKY